MQTNQSRQTVADQLINGPVVVVFTKKDGTERIMPCTVNESILSSKGETASSYLSVTDSVATVFDLEVGQWRSFRWDSVKSTTPVVV